MSPDAVAHYLLQLPGVREDRKWGSNRVFSIAGNKMIAILDFMGDGLAFNLPRGAKNKANKVCIRLVDDLYRVAFYSIRGVNVTERGEFERIYGDRLAALFTEQTGFDTHL